MLYTSMLLLLKQKKKMLLLTKRKMTNLGSVGATSIINKLKNEKIKVGWTGN